MRLAKVSSKCLRAIAAVAMLSVLSPVPFAAEIDVAEILKCQAMQDDASRLACYDSLNSPTTPAAEPPAAGPAKVEPPPAAPVPAKGADAPAEKSAVAEEATVNESVPLDDKIGKESLRGNVEKEKLIVRGRVISCREDLTSKYRFYFDNGQIWRQKDNKRITWDKCEFDVTISKDFFGYKMTPEGEKRHIRVARIQ